MTQKKRKKNLKKITTTSTSLQITAPNPTPTPSPDTQPQYLGQELPHHRPIPKAPIAMNIIVEANDDSTVTDHVANTTQQREEMAATHKRLELIKKILDNPNTTVQGKLHTLIKQNDYFKLVKEMLLRSKPAELKDIEQITKTIDYLITFLHTPIKDRAYQLTELIDIAFSKIKLYLFNIPVDKSLFICSEKARESQFTEAMKFINDLLKTMAGNFQTVSGDTKRILAQIFHDFELWYDEYYAHILREINQQTRSSISLPRTAKMFKQLQKTVWENILHYSATERADIPERPKKNEGFLIDEQSQLMLFNCSRIIPEQRREGIHTEEFNAAQSIFCAFLQRINDNQNSLARPGIILNVLLNYLNPYPSNFFPEQLEKMKKLQTAVTAIAKIPSAVCIMELLTRQATWIKQAAHLNVPINHVLRNEGQFFFPSQSGREMLPLSTDEVIYFSAIEKDTSAYINSIKERLNHVVELLKTEFNCKIDLSCFRKKPLIALCYQVCTAITQQVIEPRLNTHQAWSAEDSSLVDLYWAMTTFLHNDLGYIHHYYDAELTGVAEFSSALINVGNQLTYFPDSKHQLHVFRAANLIAKNLEKIPLSNQKIQFELLRSQLLQCLTKSWNYYGDFSIQSAEHTRQIREQLANSELPHELQLAKLASQHSFYDFDPQTLTTLKLYDDIIYWTKEFCAWNANSSNTRVQIIYRIEWFKSIFAIICNHDYVTHTDITLKIIEKFQEIIAIYYAEMACSLSGEDQDAEFLPLLQDISRINNSNFHSELQPYFTSKEQIDMRKKEILWRIKRDVLLEENMRTLTHHNSFQKPTSIYLPVLFFDVFYAGNSEFLTREYKQLCWYQQIMDHDNFEPKFLRKFYEMTCELHQLVAHDPCAIKLPIDIILSKLEDMSTRLKRVFSKATPVEKFEYTLLLSWIRIFLIDYTELLKDIKGLLASEKEKISQYTTEITTLINTLFLDKNKILTIPTELASPIKKFIAAKDRVLQFEKKISLKPLPRSLSLFTEPAKKSPINQEKQQTIHPKKIKKTKNTTTKKTTEKPKAPVVHQPKTMPVMPTDKLLANDSSTEKADTSSSPSKIHLTPLKKENVIPQKNSVKRNQVKSYKAALVGEMHVTQEEIVDPVLPYVEPALTSAEPAPTSKKSGKKIPHRLQPATKPCVDQKEEIQRLIIACDLIKTRRQEVKSPNLVLELTLLLERFYYRLADVYTQVIQTINKLPLPLADEFNSLREEYRIELTKIITAIQALGYLADKKFTPMNDSLYEITYLISQIQLLERTTQIPSTPVIRVFPTDAYGELKSALNKKKDQLLSLVSRDNKQVYAELTAYLGGENRPAKQWTVCSITEKDLHDLNLLFVNFNFMAKEHARTIVSIASVADRMHCLQIMRSQLQSQIKTINECWNYAETQGLFSKPWEILSIIYVNLHDFANSHFNINVLLNHGQTANYGNETKATIIADMKQRLCSLTHETAYIQKLYGEMLICNEHKPYLDWGLFMLDDLLVMRSEHSSLINTFIRSRLANSSVKRATDDILLKLTFFATKPATAMNTPETNLIKQQDSEKSIDPPEGKIVRQS